MLRRMVRIGMAMGVMAVTGLATMASAIDKEFYGGQEGLRCSKIIVQTAKGVYHGKFPCEEERNHPYARFRTVMHGIRPIPEESVAKVTIFVHGKPVVFSVEDDVFNGKDDSFYIAFVGIFTKPQFTPVLASNAYDVDYFPRWMGLERMYTHRSLDHLRKEWAIKAESKGFKIDNIWREFFRMEME